MSIAALELMEMLCIVHRKTVSNRITKLRSASHSSGACAQCAKLQCLKVTSNTFAKAKSCSCWP
eukprot:3487094-Amphidinium_carterae.1